MKTTLVKEIMVPLADYATVNENAAMAEAVLALEQAIHQFVLVRTQSLLVKNTRDITGILRLSDVVETIFGLIKQCPVQNQ